MIQQLTIEQLLFGEGTETNAEANKGIPSNEKGKEVLLLLDGPNMLNRAYYATSFNPDRIMTAPDGRQVNGVHGFLQMMNQYRKQLQPSRIAVCWDEGKSWRKEVYPEYKENRKETPPGLKSQFPIIQDILKKIGVHNFMDQEYEADDFIASLKEKFLKEYPNGKVFIISNDQDLLQLIDENTIVISRKNKEDIHYNEERFTKDYHGFKPQQIIDLKSIQGDNSDNIKGIPGIGEAGAIKLLQKYQSVEEVLKNKEGLDSSFNRYRKKIIENGEEGLFSKKLTTLIKDIEQINNINLNTLLVKIDTNTLMTICEELQFAQLMRAINSGKWN